MFSWIEVNSIAYKDHILTTTLSQWSQKSILILKTILVYVSRTTEIKAKLFSYIRKPCACMFLVKWRELSLFIMSFITNGSC